MLRRRVALAIIAAVAGVAGVLAIPGEWKVVRESGVLYRPALDREDPKAFLQWADLVFVGEVVRERGSFEDIDGTTMTRFDVSVVRTVKGEPPPVVRVNQLGGLTLWGFERVTWHGEEPLRPGSRYLIIGRTTLREPGVTLALGYDRPSLEDADDVRRTLRRYA